MAIERIFGEGTRHTQDFEDISYHLSYFTIGTQDPEFEAAYRSGESTAITVIESFIDEIEEYWQEEAAEYHVVEIGAVENNTHYESFPSGSAPIKSKMLR